MEHILQQLQHAPFDERISVTALLLGGLNESFSVWEEREKYTEELFGWLKQYKQGLEQGSLLLEEIREKAEIRIEQERAGRLLERKDEKRKEKVLQTLRMYCNRLRQQRSQERYTEDFETVRSWFLEELQLRDAQADKTGGHLSHALAFMDQCFSSNREELEAGPEMIYFLTELESNASAIAYIRENGSEEFYRYTAGMFTDRKRESLLSEIKEMREIYE